MKYNNPIQDSKIPNPSLPKNPNGRNKSPFTILTALKQSNNKQCLFHESISQVLFSPVLPLRHLSFIVNKNRGEKHAKREAANHEMETASSEARLAEELRLLHILQQALCDHTPQSRHGESRFRRAIFTSNKLFT